MKTEDTLVNTALDFNTVFTEPPVALSVMMAVSSRVATTARPVLMKRERLFFRLFFMKVPYGTD